MADRSAVTAIEYGLIVAAAATAILAMVALLQTGLSDFASDVVAAFAL